MNKNYYAPIVAAFLIAIIAGISLGTFLGLSRYKNHSQLIDEDRDGFPALDEAGLVVDCNDFNPNEFPSNIEIPDDGVDQDCIDGDLHINAQIPNNTKAITLYKNFIFKDSIDTTSIMENSKLIKITGKIATANLKIKAEPSEYGSDPNRKHSVYFYIDSGTNGGHIDAQKDKTGSITEGYFTITTGGIDKQYDLSSLPLSGHSSPLNVMEILNASEKHYIGAFVATGIYGILDDFTIEYTCAGDTTCEISIL
ncbi:MAG: hypothetical protein WC846_02505 [Candidatus Gracilibacteria bacterium]|jgi:hypothetical protein